jgi:hypothetical protein
MKRLFISLVAAVFAVSAEASGPATPAPTPTNVVSFYNLQLNYTSLVSTNTNYVTNITTHLTSKTHVTVTNVTTNIYYQSVSKAIATLDVINALTTNTAPSGSTLARVRQTNGVSYTAVRHAGTNVLVLDGAHFSFANGFAVPIPKPEFHRTITATSTNEVGTVEELVSASFTTPTLTFNGEGDGSRTWTGDTFTIGTVALLDYADSASVAGTGSDSSGADEIVTGTITLGGDSLQN